MLSKIRQLQPRPWWFIAAPVAAFLLAELPVVLPLLFPAITPFPAPMDSVVVAIWLSAIALVYGLAWFPVGLLGIFVWDANLMQEYGAIFCYAGWSVYAVLIAAGLQYPRRTIFFVLVLLLVLNIAGYHTGHVRGIVFRNLIGGF
jgi:hypothetical protein